MGQLLTFKGEIASSCCGQGATTRHPGRWHLMENASRAFLDAVRKSTRQVRTAVGTATGIALCSVELVKRSLP